jgi:hypothetical protein
VTGACAYVRAYRCVQQGCYSEYGRICAFLFLLLLVCCHHSWDRSRGTSLTILRSHSTPLCGLTSFHSVGKLVWRTVQLMSSPRLRECDAGALILRTVFHWCVCTRAHAISRHWCNRQLCRQLVQLITSSCSHATAAHPYTRTRMRSRAHAYVTSLRYTPAYTHAYMQILWPCSILMQSRAQLHELLHPLVRTHSLHTPSHTHCTATFTITHHHAAFARMHS